MPFMCEFCGKVFKREREVVYHEWRHTGTPKNAVKEVDTPTDAEDAHVGRHEHACNCQHRVGGDGGETD